MLIAIKGLIGSGKTTTAEYLHEKYGAYHYNCDARVKSIYKTHKEVIAAVNSQVLDTESDVIDIQQLRTVAFGDAQKLLKLESIIYPYLVAEVDSICEEYPIVLLDCQQVDKMELEIDYNFLLKLDDEKLIERVIARDGRSESQIKDILAIQRQYELKSDYTIENSGSKQQLKEKIDEVMERVNEKASR